MVPDPIAWALTRDVAAWMTRRIPATADLRADGYGTVRLGSGDLAGPSSWEARRAWPPG
jgi:hypothetical protein